MDAFYERLIVRAATIDELLSDDFEALPGQKGDADLAARRLATWCQSSASGDWSLFGQRLQRDGWAIDEVLKRFRDRPPQSFGFSVRPGLPTRSGSKRPCKTAKKTPTTPAARSYRAPCVRALVQTPGYAGGRTSFGRTSIGETVRQSDGIGARSALRHSLLRELSDLCAPGNLRTVLKARAGAAPAKRNRTELTARRSTINSSPK